MYVFEQNLNLWKQIYEFHTFSYRKENNAFTPFIYGWEDTDFPVMLESSPQIMDCLFEVIVGRTQASLRHTGKCTPTFPCLQKKPAKFVCLVPLNVQVPYTGAILFPNTFQP